MTDQRENKMREWMGEILELAHETDNKELILGLEAAFNVFRMRVFPQMAISNAKKAGQTVDKESMIKGKVIQYRKRV